MSEKQAVKTNGADAAKNYSPFSSNHDPVFIATMREAYASGYDSAIANERARRCLSHIESICGVCGSTKAEAGCPSCFASQLDLMRDEFMRIKCLTSDGEIAGLCDRAIKSLTQRVSVIEQRDIAEEKNKKLEALVSTKAISLNDLAKLVHTANIKWWQDLETGQPIKRNKGELLALIHSEISEALEGERKDLMDDKLPHRKMAEVELVDALIRILDYAAGFGYDLEGAFVEKMAYNAKREDHKHEARRIAGGKQW